MADAFIPWGIDREGDNFDSAVTSAAVETTGGSKANIQPSSSSIIDDDVTVGSGMAETIISTAESPSLKTIEGERTHAEAIAGDDRALQYGLIGGGFLILFCVAMMIMYVTRKWPKVHVDEEMTSTEVEERVENYYEIGENSGRRSSMVNQAFHSTETWGQNNAGLSEQAMTFNVLYALEQQDPDYAVIDEGTQPEQTSERPPNPESMVYAIFDKTKNGPDSNINQSNDMSSKKPVDNHTDSQLAAHTGSETSNLENALPINQSDNPSSISDPNQPVRDLYASVITTEEGVKSTVYLTNQA